MAHVSYVSNKNKVKDNGNSEYITTALYIPTQSNIICKGFSRVCCAIRTLHASLMSLLTRRRSGIIFLCLEYATNYVL